MNEETYVSKHPNTPEYEPRVGDMVVFPNAPAHWNRTTPYEVKGVGVSGIIVTYTLETDEWWYTLSNENCLALEMRRAE